MTVFRAFSFDSSKAFDTVPHQTVCDKVKGFGINLYVINWIIDLLRNRKQRVVVGGRKTEFA